MTDEVIVRSKLANDHQIQLFHAEFWISTRCFSSLSLPFLPIHHYFIFHHSSHLPYLIILLYNINIYSAIAVLSANFYSFVIVIASAYNVILSLTLRSHPLPSSPLPCNHCCLFHHYHHTHYYCQLHHYHLNCNCHCHVILYITTFPLFMIDIQSHFATTSLLSLPQDHIYSLTFGGKKYWLLVIDDSSNYSWSFFLKEKYNLGDIMIGLIKNLKNKYNIQIQYLCCNNAGKMLPSRKHTNRKGWGVTLSIQP